ncbi:FadR/GntR family transcriptional regulator [Desulfovibrio ferrophilus]|uniref:Regulatory protein GntR HTH n=1 Tax=Desulfovibrio ferrophilus TaxID=241368 RepID=A0A2Z6B3N9_9BACT|nr:GntR family transcriptional regulator [Desulfovibrio ferrophilus]BBD10046.1 regulatory protein GntR HTH [Desulfovibrio ferrophilus]
MIDTQTFTPAQTGRASEDVALQLEAAILSGKVLPGESLPSERELQTLFKTGRGVIREALRVLRQKGMVEVRKGAKGGTYVKHIDMSNVSESLALFLRQNKIDPQHVIAFRESMDRTLAALAIINASEDEKQALLDGTRALGELALSPDLDQHLLGEMDRELNIQFAKMSGNPVFEWVMGALQLGFSSQDYALYAHKKFREQTARNWQNTAQAIVDGDLLKCTALIGRHYLLLRECVETAHQQPSDVTELLGNTGQDTSASA